jgi:hypothetical protein
MRLYLVLLFYPQAAFLRNIYLPTRDTLLIANVHAGKEEIYPKKITSNQLDMAAYNKTCQQKRWRDLNKVVT